MLLKEKIAAEFFFHPNGFILAIPAGSIGREKLDRLLREIYRRHRKCLLKADTINRKLIIRPFDRMPQVKGPCLNMLDTLCKGIGIEEVELSGDLVAYDNSGILKKYMLNRGKEETTVASRLNINSKRRFMKLY